MCECVFANCCYVHHDSCMLWLSGSRSVIVEERTTVWTNLHDLLHTFRCDNFVVLHCGIVSLISSGDIARGCVHTCAVRMYVCVCMSGGASTIAPVGSPVGALPP